MRVTAPTPITAVAVAAEPPVPVVPPVKLMVGTPIYPPSVGRFVILTLERVKYLAAPKPWAVQFAVAVAVVPPAGAAATTTAVGATL